MEKVKLNNDLTLYYEKVKTNTVALAIGVRIGSIYEEPEKRGISHLLEHMMFKSNEKYSWKDISETVELSGGTINAATSRRKTIYFFEVLKESYDKVLDVLYWMFRNEKYKKEEFENEKKVVLTEIKKYEEDPNSWIFDLGVLALFGKSDLGDPIAGYVETVKNISKEDLEEFKQKYYDPSNMVAVLIGDIDESILNKTMEKLESLENKRKVKLKTPSRGERENKIEERNLGQYYFARAFEHNEKLERLKIFDFLYIKGMSSILFKELREKRGIGYSISSWAEREFYEIVVNGYVKEKHKELLEVLEKLYDFELDEKFVSGKKRQFEFSIEKLKNDLFERVYYETSTIMEGYDSLEDFKRKVLKEDWFNLPKFEKFADALIR